MKAKTIAVIAVAVIAISTAYVCLTWTEKDELPLVIAPIYDDCYLDVTDADSLSLRNEPTGSKVLGMNIEDCYDGDTLYKTVGGKTYPVQMYKLSDIGIKVEQEIDRKVRTIEELTDDAFLITYYGKVSNSNSAGLLRAGYTYDPNSQLTYLVDSHTGKMYNLTKFTREIVRTPDLEEKKFTWDNSTPKDNSVSDVRYSFYFDGLENGKYRFLQYHQIGYTVEGTIVNFQWEWRYVYLEVSGVQMLESYGSVPENKIPLEI